MKFERLRKDIEIATLTKEGIIRAWLSDEEVRDRLLKNGVSPLFFASHFAGRVLDYTFGVISGSRELGNCPVIYVMLIFFKEKNIPLGDIFVVCAGLKNAILKTLLKKNSLDEETLSSAAYLMDMNFEGLIGEYISLSSRDFLNTDEARKAKAQTQKIEKPQEPKLCHTPFCGGVKSHISALEYKNEVTVEQNDLDEMRELEEDALAAMFAEDMITEYGKDKFIRAVKKYANILNSLLEFTSLGYALTILCEVALSCNVAFLPEQTKKRVTVFCSAMIEDLREWRYAVFERSDAKDIHWMDDGFLSGASQLQIMLMPKGKEDDENGLELF